MRQQVDERRAELANAALHTLAELGYARTSLREIAQNTEFSHGVLHYYFADKYELIMFCVRQYKAVCVQRYDEIAASGDDAGRARERLRGRHAATLREDFALHRLWYDLRGQSLYEPSFKVDVTEIDRSLERMIWRIVTGYSTLSKQPLRVDSPLAYAMFDGIVPAGAAQARAWRRASAQAPRGASRASAARAGRESYFAIACVMSAVNAFASVVTTAASRTSSASSSSLFSDSGSRLIEPITAS